MDEHEAIKDLAAVRAWAAMILTPEFLAENNLNAGFAAREMIARGVAILYALSVDEARPISSAITGLVVETQAAAVTVLSRSLSAAENNKNVGAPRRRERNGFLGPGDANDNVVPP